MWGGFDASPNSKHRAPHGTGLHYNTVPTYMSLLLLLLLLLPPHRVMTSAPRRTIRAHVPVRTLWACPRNRDESRQLPYTTPYNSTYSYDCTALRLHMEME